MLAAGVLGIPGCGKEGGGEVDDPKLPYSFSYPAGFGEAEEVELGATRGFGRQTVVASGEGSELVAVQARDQRPPVTAKVLPRVKRRLANIAAGLGRPNGRREVTVDGVRAFQFDLSLGGRPPTEARATYVPKADTIALVYCQWQRERQQVLGACGEVLDSLKLR